MTFCTYDSTIQQKFNMHICDHILGKGNPYILNCNCTQYSSRCILLTYSVQNHNASERSSSSTTLHHLSKMCKFKIIDSGGIRTHAISDWCLKPAP